MEEQSNKQKDFENFITVVSEIFEKLGSISVDIGNMEKTNPKGFASYTQLEKDPEFFLKMTEHLPPESLGRVMRVFIKLSSLSSKLNNIMSLSDEEKIQLGNELKSLSKELKSMSE